MKVYEAMADAFAAEGSRPVFALMGDANMLFLSALATRGGQQLYHARHESAAVGMADGYARATGDVGVAAITSGPGVTQIATSLTVAVRHGSPLVVFAGDTPVSAGFHLQQFDIPRFVEACGARWFRVTTVDRTLDEVQEAFLVARRDRVPVVLVVPYDLQEAEFAWAVDVRPSAGLLPMPQRLHPDPDAVDAVADLLLTAQRPLVLIGRGAVDAGAIEAATRLGDRVGALLATTLRANGAFAGHPYAVGIAGAFSSDAARALLAGTDVVLAVGARMGYYTTEGGYLFPGASIVQVDTDPVGHVDGQPVADLYLRTDARAGLDAIDAVLSTRQASASGARTAETAALLAAPVLDTAAFDTAPGTVDPRDAVQDLATGVPEGVRLVVGVGHFWNFAVPGLQGRPPDSYLYTYDFGAIGQGLPTAIGSAAVGPTVLVEGDGSLLMHVQELETMGRHRLPLLAVVIDDGAYGSEVHKLRAKGEDGSLAEFGMPDLAGVAASLGLWSATVTGPGQLPELLADWAREPRPGLIDVRVSPNVVAATYRRLFFGEVPDAATPIDLPPG